MVLLRVVENEGHLLARVQVHEGWHEARLDVLLEVLVVNLVVVVLGLRLAL